MNIIDCGKIEPFSMKLTRDNLMAALDEFDFRSERPLPNEYALIKKMIDEYFKLKKEYSKLKKEYDDLHCEMNWIKYPDRMGW